MHGYTDAKDDYLKRLRRVEGQVRGIARMVDEDVYCIDILTQVAAVTKALQAVSIGLVEDHLAPLRRRRRPAVPRGGRGEGQGSRRRHRPPRPQLHPPGAPPGAHEHHHDVRRRRHDLRPLRLRGHLRAVRPARRAGRRGPAGRRRVVDRVRRLRRAR